MGLGLYGSIGPFSPKPKGFIEEEQAALKNDSASHTQRLPSPYFVRDDQQSTAGLRVHPQTQTTVTFGALRCRGQCSLLT